jgi:putative polyketide hydroxylase
MSNGFDYPVAICGAGPVGSTLSILLSRLGVHHLLFDKREVMNDVPRARGVMARTMEIWGSFGITDDLQRYALPPRWLKQMIYQETLAGPLIAAIPSMLPSISEQRTPANYICVSQDKVDAVLLDHARKYSDVSIQLGTELVDLHNDDLGVDLILDSKRGKEARKLRVQWLVGADGAGSRVRSFAGITRSGQSDLEHFINVHFYADLSRWTADRESPLLWTFMRGCEGAMAPIDGEKFWRCQIWFDPAIDPLATWTADRVAQRVRAMIGAPENATPAIALHSFFPYTISALIADRFREKRVLLVGDAAHQIPPMGAFGMNTGVQTAHNLAWKLRSVVAGHAPTALLDTFDTERREVAVRVCHYGVRNLERVRQMRNKASVEEKRAALAGSGPSGNWLGLDLGVHYDVPGAFVPDGTPPPVVANPIADYIPCARPGCRAPHIWLRAGDKRLSAIDLFEREFVLLTGADGASWRAAAAALDTPVPLRVYTLGQELHAETESFENLYGIGAQGAVLVRPDGHVGYRSAEPPADPVVALCSALNTILQITV